jgi:hypothetical protein
MIYGCSWDGLKWVIIIVFNGDSLDHIKVPVSKNYIILLTRFHLAVYFFINGRFGHIYIDSIALLNNSIWYINIYDRVAHSIKIDYSDWTTYRSKVD